MTRGGRGMSKTYRTISGDMWDLIAYNEMGSSYYVDKLMAANPMYLDLYVFPAGVELTIPDLQQEEVNLAPLWKRRMLSE